MKKVIFKNEEVDKIILDESSIIGIRWVNNPNGNPVDIEMEIDWNGQKDFANDFDLMNIKTTMYFSLVHDAQFCFEYASGNTMGNIGISSFSYIKNDFIFDIIFNFEFGPIGFIKFRCADFYFKIIEQHHKL